jgi:hypothetical protein
MGAQRAAPEGHCQATSGGRINSGNASTLSQLGLPAHVIGLLEAEGVRTLADWRRLGRKRLQIFGVTTAVCRLIDQAAKEART